jgi:uncharacterized cupredoxin-like copper-binding protein
LKVPHTVALAIAGAALTAPALTYAHGDANHAGKKSTYDTARVQEHAFGREGDPKKVTRTIRLDMDDSFRFTPAQVSVKRGETVRFVVGNSGKLMHEMVLGTADAIKQHAELMQRFPGMEHDDPNMAHVKPGAQGEIVWQFTRAGEYPFACLIAGHYEAGMVGKVVVK